VTATPAPATTSPAEPNAATGHAHHQSTSTQLLGVPFSTHHTAYTYATDFRSGTVRWFGAQPQVEASGSGDNYIGVIIDDVRYADGGGLTPAARQRRETVRMQAAEMFAADIPAGQVAARLEVSEKSAYTWRRAWLAGGDDALRSKGPSGQTSRLSDKQLARLEKILDAGAATISCSGSPDLGTRPNRSSRRSARSCVTSSSWNCPNPRR